MSDDLATRRLINRIASGDSSAREELTRRYYADVLRYCAYRTGRQGDAEDLAQETFLKLYSYFDTYTDKHQFKAYLLKIASNVCNTWHERRKFYYDTVEIDDHLPSDEDVQGSSGTAAVIRDAVARLPDEQREVIILFYFNNMKTSAIASVQGVPAATVRTRLARGREKLKKILMKEGF